MNNKPLISVLMPVYNAEKYVQDAINSVLDQTYNNFELLIVDDNSSDRSKEIISAIKDERIRFYRNEENKGPAGSRNLLLSKVKGKYIVLLDADDLSEKNRLEMLVEQFYKDDALAMCGSFVQFIDEEGDILNLKEYPLDYETIRKEIATKKPFTGATVMIRTDVFREMNGYREFFNNIGYEDYDLHSRIVLKYKAINIPEPLYICRRHPSSTSRSRAHYNIQDKYRQHAYSIVKFLTSERLEGKKDALERGDLEVIDQLIETLEEPYQKDPSKIYRESAEIQNAEGFSKLAIINSAKAIRTNPKLLINYRTLFFCLKTYWRNTFGLKGTA